MPEIPSADLEESKSLFEELEAKLDEIVCSPLMNKILERGLPSEHREEARGIFRRIIKLYGCRCYEEGLRQGQISRLSLDTISQTLEKLKELI